MLGLPSFLCFVSLIVLAHGATLQVCQNGCQYSSVTTALQAAQSGDLVYVQTGTYANEAATPVSLLRDITLRGEVGAVVSLSFSNTLNNVWLTINGTLTLEGDLGILINGGRFTNSAIFVSPTGKIVLNGNLNILGGNVRYAGYGLTVQGVLQQKGAFTAVSNGPTTFNAVIQLDQGVWTQEAGATVDMQLRFSNGVGLSTGSSWLQKGNINMRLDQSSNGVWCLHGNKVWTQQGQVNMTVSNFSVGIGLTTGLWMGMGDVVVNVLDSGSEGIYCYNPNVNVVGDVLVRQNGACFSLLTPTRCLLKPEPCP